MRTKEIEAKSILTKSKLPDADYVVNPYTGCPFACLYCYASFMGKFVGESIESWGDYLYVKSNAVQLFAQEFPKLQRNKSNPSILLSSVTDPYNGLELKYRLTRGILEIISQSHYKGQVGILTKSPLVMRDLDLFKIMPNVEVGLTITSTNDKISRFLEVSAPPVTKRLEALHALKKEGIKTYAFLGPLLPHFKLEPSALEELIAAVAETGVNYVYVEHMNLKSYIVSRMADTLKECSSEIQSLYRAAKFQDHKIEVENLVLGLLSKYGLKLRLNEVIQH